MSEESPHFNELFVQEDRNDKEYNLDSNLLAEGREHAEEFDRKIVGFDSIDDLFSSLGSPKLKEGISKNKEEGVGQQPARAIVEQQASKNSSSRLPNITINYSQPSARDSSLNHNMGTLPTKRIETKAFKKKIVQYEERIIKVPIEKEVIEYYEVQHTANHEPCQRNFMTVQQQMKKNEEKLNVPTAQKYLIEQYSSHFKERATQEGIKQSKSSLLQRIKSQPSLTSPSKPISPHILTPEFQNPNHFNTQQQKTLQGHRIPTNLRLVTTDNYDYAQRRLLLHQLDSKMQYLKQLQAQLFKH